MNKQLKDFFQWGNAFLQRSQLRSLRNLSLLSFEDETRLIVELAPPRYLQNKDTYILYRWGELCRGQPVQAYLRSVGRRYLQTKEYLNASATEKEDPFAGCYDGEGNLTFYGNNLRMEAGLRTNADKSKAR